MTHDELIETIKKIYCASTNFLATDTVMSNALLAVVELHKQRDDNSCQHCVTWYPCDTIQAIEKELS